MMRFLWRNTLALGVLAVASSGCGFFVQMTTTGTPGGVAFNVKVTNASQCPMAPPGLLVLPFFSLSQVPAIPPTPRAGIQEFLSAACNGIVPDQLPQNVGCEIIGNNLVCSFIPDDRSGLDTSSQTSSFGVGDLQFTCAPDGNSLKCTLPLSSLPHQAGNSGNSGTDVMPFCFGPNANGLIVCLAPVETTNTLPTGGMATSSFTIPKPPNSPNHSDVTTPVSARMAARASSVTLSRARTVPGS